MLAELRLENYTVIESAAVQFAPGLNLLTGETGAGKSILIDALALLLGEKASPEVVRSGTERATISAVFEPDSVSEKAIARILESNGLDASDESLILRREILTGGKGRVFVNNQPATVAVLKQLAPHLATIHAQNETLMSFDAQSRLALLDSYAGIDSESLAKAFETWNSLRSHIAELERGEQGRQQMVDLWVFQKREIEEAHLQAGEDAQLETEKRVLANAEKIHSAAMNAFDLLYEGENSTAASLRGAQKQIEELARYEPRFGEALTALQAARISIEDVGASVRDYAGGVEASPERLGQVEDRLAALDRLKRKYGPELDDVIRCCQNLSQKLNEIENKDEVLARLRAEMAGAGKSYVELARALSRQRESAGRRLAKIVEAEISDLAMNAVFRIETSGTDDEQNWTASGFDQVTFLISTNPSEPPRKLEEIASGGELSRVMLALKASVEAGAKKKQSGSQRAMVFDEVDTGIGGRAAEAVGKKLQELSRYNQVLCVTHLPQIAMFADHHYLIEKKEASGRSRTSIREITSDHRTHELARMISGSKLTETSLKHAEQMLKQSAGRSSRPVAAR